MNNMDIQQLDSHGARPRKGWRDHLRNLGQFFSSRGGDRRTHEERAGRARPQEGALRDETRQPRPERASSESGKGKSEQIISRAPNARAARQSHEETLAILEGAAPRLGDGRSPERISPNLISEWQRAVSPGTSMSSMEPLSDMSTSNKSPRLERTSKDPIDGRDTVSTAWSFDTDRGSVYGGNKSRWSHSIRSSVSSFESDRSSLQGDSDLDRRSIDTTATDVESAVSSPEVVYSSAEIVTVPPTTVVHAKPMIIDVARNRKEPVEARRDSSKEREPRSPLEKHERTSELYDHRPPVRGR